MSRKIYCVDCVKCVGDLAKGSKVLKEITYRCSTCETKLHKPEIPPKNPFDELSMITTFKTRN